MTERPWLAASPVKASVGTDDGDGGGVGRDTPVGNTETLPLPPPPDAIAPPVGSVYGALHAPGRLGVNPPTGWQRPTTRLRMSARDCRASVTLAFSSSCKGRGGNGVGKEERER